MPVVTLEALISACPTLAAPFTYSLLYDSLSLVVCLAFDKFLISRPCPHRMAARQDSDDVAWDRSDELWEEAMKQVRLSSTCRKIEAFAQRLLGKPAMLATPLIIGGFNVLYPFRVDGYSHQLLIRLPCPNQALFPEEKTTSEAATARYIKQHTQVPVPEVFFYGVDAEVGAFMVIQDLGTRRGIVQALERPHEDSSETPVLHPEISETKLKTHYTQLARCLLQLAQPVFPRIGALIESSPGSFRVGARPITLNMSNMFQLSNIPKAIFPPEGTTYGTADEWYVALAEMQMATLLFQHNDMISSEDDCKTKYVARQIFRKLAKEGRLSTFGFAEDKWSARSIQEQATLPAPDNTGSFRLWSDDFRPVNVLVDDKDQILGAIDWEFAYVGPTQFVLDPPWWLLLDVPEMWDDGIDDWANTYERRLQTWLSAMEDAEQEMTIDSLSLSRYMKQSWESGRFWLNYAARKSWAFDTVYWKYLDERFFGTREADIPVEELWKTRLHLLTGNEQAAMEPFVHRKLEETKHRILVEWEDAQAQQQLRSVLFD